MDSTGTTSTPSVEAGSAAAPARAERRHSTRLCVSVPVMVSGTDSSGAAFREECKTVSISRRGAVIETSRPIDPGGELLIRNSVLGTVVRARALRFIKGRTAGERPQVVVELIDLKNVWGIQYPPRDWQLPAPPQIETQAFSPPLVPPGEVEVDLTGSLAELLTTRENRSAGLSDGPDRSLRQAGDETAPMLQPADEQNGRRIEESHPELVALEQRLAGLAQSVSASCATLESLLFRVRETEEKTREHVERLLEESWVRLGEQQARIASDTEKQIGRATQAALDSFLSQLAEAADTSAFVAGSRPKPGSAGKRKPTRRQAKTPGATP